MKMRKVIYVRKGIVVTLVMALVLSIALPLAFAAAQPSGNTVTLHFIKDWNQEPKKPIGPPTDVDDLPGDRKTALLWKIPANQNESDIAYYQVNMEGSGWVNYYLADPNDPTPDPDEIVWDDERGQWYLLFEYLPDGVTRLTNGTEYSFFVRAVGTNGIIGPREEITSEPSPLGNISGRNKDLRSLYGIDINTGLRFPEYDDRVVMPVGGWDYPNDHDPFNSAATPNTATLVLPRNFLFAVIHRNFVEVGEDATFKMYDDPGFLNEVDVIDRLDNSFQWLPDVHVYIHVTSGNRQIERFYDITVEPTP